MHQVSHCNIGGGSHIEYMDCVRCYQRAGWFAVGINLMLTIFKAFVGFISGSKAVLGDSLYSFKDFITSLVVVAGIRVSGKPADENHPYGHGKVEFVAILLISILMLIATFFLFIHSIKDVWLSFHDGITAPNFIAFWAAIISMVTNYKLSAYLQCVGEKLKSPAILANARHNHSDALSSALVAGAILGTKFGLLFLDPLVAVVETIDLMRLSYGMLSDSVKGILDASVHGHSIREIEEIARLVPGVRRVSKVTARQLGQSVWIDIAIKVDHDKSHEEGYAIGCRVKDTLSKRVGYVAGINLAIEPYFP